MENHLYRIAVEAINNSLRHAHASQLGVSLTRDEDNLTLLIADNGVGFTPHKDADQGGVGLRGMQDRAKQIGTQLSIHSSDGNGVQIKVEMRV